jgi:uncharacterized protein YbaR (Trm112 family)
VAAQDSLIELLACPKCRGRLERIAQPEGFVCGACSLLYPIENGLPNMLIDDAKHWPPSGAGTT